MWRRLFHRRKPAKVYPFVMDPYASHPMRCMCQWHR